MTRPVMANERPLHSARFVFFEKTIPSCTTAITI